MAEVITARNLTKRFGSFTAVDGITFSIHRGECFGLLGPNGAGKTSTVRMIQCVSPITDGELEILGLDPRREGRRIRGDLGVCPQEDNLDPDFTVHKNLLVYARYFGIPAAQARQRADDLLRFVLLDQRRHSPILELSGGMRRRLQIARALLAEPRILILDEPTTGLDPQARQLIWERIRELAGAGTTIVLTTHYMEEAARLCDRLLVMDQGRILEQGSPAELVRRHIGREVLELQDLAPQEADRLADLADPPGERIGAHLVFRTDRGAELLESIRSRGLLPERYLLRPATLEDVFLRLTGRDLRE